MSRDVDRDLERTLPANIEAERSVLGALIADNDRYPDVASVVTRGDWHRDAHRIIYAAIEARLETSGGRVDLVTLKDDLARSGDLERVGGPAYIAALVDAVPRTTNASAYARIVKEKSQLRALVHFAQRVLTDAYAAEEDAATILAEADRALVALQRIGTQGGAQPIHETIGQLLAAVEHRHAHRDTLVGAPTGFTAIDALTGGWQAGDMIVIAARPSIGKSVFALSTAVAAAQSGRTVAIVSLEMTREQLQLRLASSLSGVPLSVIQGGWCTEAQLRTLGNTFQAMAALPIHIDDASTRTMHEVRATCRRLMPEGLGLVVVDYIQLLQPGDTHRGSTRNDQIADMSRRLKRLAGECGVPVIVVSQLNRASEGRSDPRPRLSDLRESGALEQDADLVGFLHRQHHRESGVTEFIIEKQRNGPTGTVTLALDRETTTLREATSEATQDALPEIDPETAHAAKVRAIIRQRGKHKE